MTLEIFEQWFHEQFVPKVRAYLASINQEEKAVLLIDNCPAHPMKLESADGKIKGLFLPPESSSLIMPMNQGPIAYLKRKYRTNLLRNCVLDNTFIKQYSVKSAIYSLANLWRELPDDLLCSSWHKLKINLNIKYNFEKIDMTEVTNNLGKLGLSLSDHEINCWLDIDYGEPGYGFLTDQEIVESCQQSMMTKITLPAVSLMDESVKIISAKVAYNYCNELMVWLEGHGMSKPDDLISMQRIKELASKFLGEDVSDSSVAVSNFLEGDFSCVSSSGSGHIEAEEEPEIKIELDSDENKTDCIMKSVTTFLDESPTGLKTVVKLNESNGEIDKSMTTFLDEENTGSIMRLENEGTIEKSMGTKKT